MFDGADLSAVYGVPSYDAPKPAAQPIPEPTKIPQQISPPVVQDTGTYGKPVVEQMQPNTQQHYPEYVHNDSFWNRIGNKKPEIIKMFVLSLIIVLGLSLDRVAGHYMTEYVSNAILTNVQEFVVRLSYPVGVILFLWILKASM